jgi:hypothetical protein
MGFGGNHGEKTGLTMRIAFCNIGTRDVRVSDQPRAENIRNAGQALLDRFEEIYTDLQFPVVESTLAYISGSSYPPLQQIVFIGTDQPDTPQSQGLSDADISFRDKDTLFYAQLASQTVERRYPHLVKEVRFDTVDVNPSLYDEAFDAYGVLIRKYLKELQGEKVTACYVLVGSGTPACNTALILQTIRHLGDVCHVIYQPHKAQPRELDAGRQVIHVLQENTAEQLLNRFDFNAAQLFLEKCGASEMTLELTRYATARLWFAFDDAQEHLRQAIRSSRGRNRTILMKMEERLAHLVTGDDDLARIGELYHNAQIAWDNGHYMQFLGRLTRFYTAVLSHQLQTLSAEVLPASRQPAIKDLANQPELRHLLLQTLKTHSDHGRPQPVSLSDDESRAFRADLRDKLNAHFSLSDLQNLCFDLSIDYEQISGNDKNTKVINLIEYMERQSRVHSLIATAGGQRPDVEWFQHPTEESRSQVIICDALLRLDHLVTLQNQSIIGQGYQGISKKKIEQFYPKSATGADASPGGDMSDICNALGISVSNPFREISDLIIKELKNPDE